MSARITMIDPSCPPAQLAQVTTLYTDLDGSFLAPGGTALRSADGTPSAEAVECLLALRAAGIDVVIVTGRNRAQCSEISRILDVGTYIGELGGFTSFRTPDGTGDTMSRGRTLEFHRGAWADLPAGSTPLQMMEADGVVEKLCALYPGRVERVPMDIVNQREVTALVIGQIDVAEAATAISTPERPLQIIDNGEVYPTNHGLELDGGIHIYHILPAGIGKDVAVRLDMERRGIGKAQALAIGDSCGDIGMARAAGTFVLVGNGLEMPEVQEGLQEQGIDVLAVPGHNVDGWVQCAKALLAARGATLR